jgi:hypothetical protein
MHRRQKIRRLDIDYRSRNFIIVAATSLAVIIAGCLAIIFTAGNGASGSIQSIYPPSAQSVADNLNCASFKDYGGGMASGLGERLTYSDVGTCYVDGKKYAIATFASQDVRDEWVSLADQIGITPKWTTDTAVVYLDMTNPATSISP